MTDTFEKPFQLIETMLWENGELRHLKLHVNRLRNGASRFQMPFRESTVVKELGLACAGLNPGITKRVRMLYDKTGIVEITVAEVTPPPEPLTLCVSPVMIHSGNPFLYHKTTNRDLYTSERERAKMAGYYDILFQNQRYEITEGAGTNIYLEDGGELYTPPKSSGLLPGTYREHLLLEHRATERVLTLSQLRQAEKIYVTNAIIGLREVANGHDLPLLPFEG